MNKAFLREAQTSQILPCRLILATGLPLAREDFGGRIARDFRTQTQHAQLIGSRNQRIEYPRQQTTRLAQRVGNLVDFALFGEQRARLEEALFEVLKVQMTLRRRVGREKHLKTPVQAIAVLVQICTHAPAYLFRCL